MRRTTSSSRDRVPEHSTGSWSPRHPAVYRLDLSRLRRPVATAPRPPARSRPLPLVPGARRGRHLRHYPARAWRSTRNQRDGAGVVPAAPPQALHLHDRHASVPVAADAARLRPDPRPPAAPHRWAGERLRWVVRCGDYAEVHPLHGVQRRAAVHQRALLGHRAPTPLVAEARTGCGGWRRCGARSTACSSSGRDRLGQPGRHLPGRPRPPQLPQADDRDTRHADRFISHRPVFRAAPPGHRISSQPGRPGRRRSPWPHSQTPARARRGRLEPGRRVFSTPRGDGAPPTRW
jgi:hypothetical protein